MAGEMTQNEMNALAQKLAGMSYNRAKGHIRSLDRQGHITQFRNAFTPGNWITRFELPNKKVMITLVEQHEEYGPADDLGHRKMRFKYVEALVEALEPARS